MSVVAFLASAVDPRVAARAAGEAIEQLESSLKNKVEKDEPKQDAMEVEPQDDVAGQGQGGGVGTEGEVTDGVETKANGTQSNGREEPEDKSNSSPKANLEKAALVALGSAAAKAHALALEEDASLHSLVTSIVDAQTRKLDLKLKHFDELESLLELERRAMEQQKQELFHEKAKMQKMMNEAVSLWQRAKQGQAAGISPHEIQTVMSQSTGRTPQAYSVQDPEAPPKDQEGDVLHLA